MNWSSRRKQDDEAVKHFKIHNQMATEFWTEVTIFAWVGKIPFGSENLFVIGKG